jgi:adenosine kinase
VNAQIGSFYTGAMAEARYIELQPIAARAGKLNLVVISPNDPEAMLRHTDECRSRGFDFVADPSQQMAWLDGPHIKQLIDGATYLFSNDYEDGLITQKTGWSHEEVLERVAVRVITRGAKGSSCRDRRRTSARHSCCAGSRARRPDRRRRCVPFRIPGWRRLGGAAGALRAAWLLAGGLCH